MKTHQTDSKRNIISILTPSMRGLKILGRIAVVLLVAVAIIVGITRSLFPYIDRYRTWFEEKISSAIEQPVKIQKVQASWQGLHPVLKFAHVDILDDTKQKKLIQVPELEVSINVLNSLIHQRLIPQSSRIVGMRLAIYERENRTLEINGIQTSMTTEKNDGSPEEGVQQFFEWLLSQPEMSLDQVDIDWHSREGVFLPLTNVQLTLRRGFFDHQAIGFATLAQQVPAKFRFVITLKGNLLKRQLLSAHTYIYIKDLDAEPWMEKHTWKGMVLTHGRINHLRLWVDWQPGGFRDIQGLVDIQGLNFYSTADRKTSKIRHLTGNLAWKKNDNGWTFAVDDLELNLNGHIWPLNQAGFRTANFSSGRTEVLKLDRIDVASLDQILFLFPSLKQSFEQTMADIQPRGLFKNMLLRRDISQNQTENMSLVMDIDYLETLPWKNLPGVTGLNGHIMASSSSGRLSLKGKNLGLDFGGLFPAPFLLEHYAGTVEWLKSEDGWQIHANDVTVNDDAFTLSTNADIFLSQDTDTAPFIFLDSAFTQKNPEDLHKYVPVRILPAGLTKWLNEAFVGPGNITGQFLLHGPLDRFPFDQQEGRFEMVAKIDHVPFNYRSGWPGFTSLSANVLLNGRHLVIEGEQGEIFEVNAEKIYAEIPDLATSELFVTGSLSADSAKGLSFISHSPLQATLGKKLEVLQVSGPMHVDLNLTIPLHKGNPPLSLKGDVALFPGGKLAIPDWKIYLDNVGGAFSFTQNSLTAEKIVATWLNHPVTLTMNTNSPSPDESVIRVNAIGEISVEDIEKTYATNALHNIVQGVTNYDLALQFMNSKGKSRTTFSISSDLTGINIQLPQPLAKNAQEKKPSNVALSFGENSFDLTGNYGNTLTAALRFVSAAAHWDFSRGEVRFGTTPAVVGNAPGLRVKGQLSRLNLADIKPWLSSVTDQKNKQKTAFPIDMIDMNIGTLEAFGFTLSPVSVTVKSVQKGWRVGVNNPLIAGWFILPQANTNGSIVGEFSRFYLVADGVDKGASSIRPDELPPLDILLSDFRYGHRMIGKLYVTTSPEKNGMRIKRLALSSPSFVLNGNGFWQRFANGKTQSTLSGELRANNMGNVLRSWAVTESLVGANGRITFAISWPGDIYRPKFSSMDGRLSLDFKQGRIINISQSSEAELGLGRLLNLFSLQSLPRRLTLDFRDFSEKGFPFDVVKGDFRLNDGNAVTQNTYMDGALAKVELNGAINIHQKIYNLTMQVTPYVTGSLPIVATVIGGPAAGAAAWVADKVIGRVVNEMTSSTYRVTGPWDAPRVDKVGAQRRGR